MNIWAIIPVKPLRDSKSRLSHILSPDDRAALTGSFLAYTLDVLRQVRSVHRTLVVSRDPAVLKLARQYGAVTFGESDKQDLNLALTRATHIAVAQRADSVLILPSDLPFLTPEDVELMIAGSNPHARSGNGNGRASYCRYVAICTDHNSDGTNALLVCPPTGFTFQYGPNSFRLHLEEAARLGMDRQIIHTPGIKFDLDTEKDWETFQALRPEAVPAIL